ncbi:MAG: TadE/TadG family type IV pilus assembly protein [Chloroflexota bacterium]
MTTVARGRQAGQGVIEFALLITLLLLVLLGTVDFSRFLYYQTALASAARVAAETAQSPCPAASACGNSESPATYDFVLQSASCEGGSALNLQPVIPCTPVTSTSSPCTSTCSPCTGDVCVQVCTSDTSCTTSPYAPGGGPYNEPSSPESIKVTVGYNFQPITPLINDFFPQRQCFSGAGTENPHTLCATSVGRLQ